MKTPAASSKPVNPVVVGKIPIGGGNPFVLIAGPCVIESEKMTLNVAEYLAILCGDLKIPFIFKASYDKANRTSIHSYRGPGLKEGLRILAAARRKLGILVLSDIHEPVQAEPAAEVLDVLQVPAFLCRQTDLLVAAGKTGRPVEVKKGQYMAPADMKHAYEKIASTGNRQVLIAERGAAFGYNNLVVDMRSIVVLKDLGCPVVYDATHSLQLPGGAGDHSGGERKYFEPLTRAAIAVGIDALFVETHPDPDKALSDPATQIPLKQLPRYLKAFRDLDAHIKSL